MYDITLPVGQETSLWPGDPPLEVEWPQLISRGSSANVSRVSMGMHVGTHADAPFHVRTSGMRMGEVRLEPFIGRAVLVDLPANGRIDEAFAAELLLVHPEPLRVLIRTGAWSDTGFPEKFPAVEPEAVRLLGGAGVVLIGTDAPSVDSFDAHQLGGHEALVEQEISILENLFLDGIPAGEYELIALPLKLMELDGSPVRAVLREL
jgi:arylformamidase